MADELSDELQSPTPGLDTTKPLTKDLQIDPGRAYDPSAFLDQQRFPDAFPHARTEYLLNGGPESQTVGAAPNFAERYQDAVSNAKDGWDYLDRLVGFGFSEIAKRNESWGINSPDKAADIMAMSDALSRKNGQYVSPMFVAENYKTLAPLFGGDPQLSTGELLMTPFTAVPQMIGRGAEELYPGSGKYASMGSMAVGTAALGGLPALGGLALFHAQGEALDIIRAYKDSRPHEFLQTSSLADFAPQDANDSTKAFLELADIYLKGLGAAGGYQATGAIWKAAAYRDFSFVVPGNSVYISPEDLSIRARGFTPQQYGDVLQRLGIRQEQVNLATQHGIDLEIPLSKVAGSMDAPWFSTVKDFFHVSPYGEGTVTPEGELSAKVHTAGELEAPGGGEAKPAAGSATPPPGGTSPVGAIQTPPSGPVPDAIKAEAQKQGVDPNLQLAIWKAEGSVTNPATKNPASNATGIFQHIPSTWAAQGGTPENRFDQAKQIELGVALTKANIDTLTKSLGRAPEAWEVYAAHQQGAGGFEKLLANPDAKAVDVINPKAVTLNGGTADMTASQFLDHIKQYFTKQSSATGPVRSRVAATMAQNPAIPPEQADSIMSQLDQHAQFAAQRDGTTPDEWYDKYVAGNGPAQVGERSLLDKLLDPLRSERGAIGEGEKDDKIPTLKTGEADTVKATVDGIVSKEQAERANPIYGLNAEYDKALKDQVGAAIMSGMAKKPGKGEITTGQTRLLDKLLKPLLNERGTLGDQHSPNYIQAEAARRAEAIIQETEANLRKKFTTDLRKEAESHYANLSEPKIINELKVRGLNRKSLETWDKDTVTHIARRFPGLVKKNGMWGVEEAAHTYGYESDDALVQMLTSLPTKGAFIENHITEGLKHHEDRLSLTALERLAVMVDQELAVMSEAQGAGMTQADQAAGMKPEWSASGMRKAADIEQKTDYANLKAGIQMAARAAKIAYREGKINEAIRQKIRQKNLIMGLRAEMEARKQFKDLFRKINKIADTSVFSAKVEEGDAQKSVKATVPVEYRKQIAQILQSVGWKGFDKVRVTDPEPLADFLQRKFDEGEIYESDFGSLDAMRGKPLRDISLNALHDLHDCLNELLHKAKTIGILQTTADRKAVAEAGREMAQRIMQYHNPMIMPAGSEHALAPYDERDGTMRRALAKLRQWNIANLEVETLMEWADGWTKELGPNWNYGYKPINDGSTALYELEKRSAEFGKILERFGTKIKGIGPWAEQKYFFPELGGKFLRKSQMMAVALHYGNAGNRAALRNSFKIPDEGGAPQSLTEQQVWAVISKLTAEEWQAVLDTAKIWNNPVTQAQLADTYLKNTGNEFPFLELGKVTIPHLGEVPEWHAPMVDDKDASYQMEKRGAMDEGRDLFSRNYRPQSPKNGFTKQRRANARHILDLDFVSVVSKFLADQNRYIALTIPIRDTQKIFNEPAFRQSMENYLSKDYHRMLLPWLQDIARPQSELLSAPVRALTKLRKNGVMVHIGLKFWTFLKHTPQLLMISESVSGPRVMQAIFSPHNGTIIRPFTARALIEQDNPFMQGFFDKSDRDISQFYTNFDPARWQIKHTFDHVMLSGIELMVNFLARTAWIAEFNARMADPKALYNIDQAREYANKVVRDNLGSYDPKDLSKMRRGSELDKMLTAFMTVPAALYQKFFRMGAQAFGPEQGNPWERIFRFVRSAMYVIVALAVAAAFFEKRRIPRAIEMVKQLPMTVTNTVPLLRDVVGSFMNGHDYSLSFVGDAMKSIVDAGKHMTGIAAGQEKWSKYAFERSMTALGFWTGLPTDQMTITGEGLSNLGQSGHSPLEVLVKPPAKEYGPRHHGKRW